MFELHNGPGSFAEKKLYDDEHGYGAWSRMKAQK